MTKQFNICFQKKRSWFSKLVRDRKTVMLIKFEIFFRTILDVVNI